ncbi:hypothetical protein DKX38_027760 [Salix brachista]|uniref:NB-ARC domain-containing protein n=1 Tax=Salix brachista TaxID=2182728 RepID=A0A5N5J7W6_9ROSI|nr:hypothetical protein DKX38_027760 [Salix brachista]
MDIEQKQAELINHFVNQASTLKASAFGLLLSKPLLILLSLPSLKFFLQRTENSLYLDVLRLFAHGTWTDYKNRETDSFLDSSEVVGREDDVSIVTDRLATLMKQHVLSVVPIVGMAGLGKTTVAKKVCEVVRERKHFDVTLWVCVSNDFSKRRILDEMLQKIDKSTGGLTNLDAIIEKLQEKLKNKTFFLVLDDVWNEDHGKWDGLKEQLLKISSEKGNVVVVTTRITEIATMMETSRGSQHKPRGLSDDECWSIIKQKVSGDGGATLAADFESIGKEIAKKCGGLPLLAKEKPRSLKEAMEWLFEAYAD